MNENIDKDIILEGDNTLENATVPYRLYEKAMYREAREKKRKDKIIVLLVLLVFLSHAMWLLYFNSFDTVTTTTVQQDTEDGGNANYIGQSGVISNGAADNTDDNTNQEEHD